MYKHVAVLEMRLEIETEDSLSAEELEEMLHEIDYEFSSDYGNITTQIIKESSILQSNRIVK